jgi:ATP adenylyltransferase
VSLDRLWAPWRQIYIASVRSNKRTTGRARCLFCQKGQAQANETSQVLVRGVKAFTLLNLYPYNNGHLMVAPYRHVGLLERLEEAEWLEMLHLIQDGMARLKRVMKPDGFNVGFNLGRTAGAGVPGHLHLHLVPRWNGDTNFMPVIAHTKVISQSLREAYRALRHSTGAKTPPRLPPWVHRSPSPC